MTGMGNLILTVNQLADMQAKNDFTPRDALPLVTHESADFTIQVRCQCWHVTALAGHARTDSD
jgi:hypothetical protein